ncbi:hypothetical protein NKJ68_28620, partial [Mesorhizobium sp. M0053]
MSRGVVPAGQGGYAADQPQGMIRTDMTSALPFDDFRNLLASLPPADTVAEVERGRLPVQSRRPGPEAGGGGGVA